jgi:hypothetical protein
MVRRREGDGGCAGLDMNCQRSERVIGAARHSGLTSAGAGRRVASVTRGAGVIPFHDRALCRKIDCLDRQDADHRSDGAP